MTVRRGCDIGAVGFHQNVWTGCDGFYFRELMRQVESVIRAESRSQSSMTHMVTVATSGASTGPGVRFEPFHSRWPSSIDLFWLLGQKLATTPLWTIRVESSIGPGGVQPWGALWWLMASAALYLHRLACSSSRGPFERRPNWHHEKRLRRDRPS